MKRSQKSRKTVNKSGKKPCQICKKPNILQTHHIEGRNIPNANHPSNLVDICPNCHGDIHWGVVVIERWVMTSSGSTLIWHKKDEESFTGSDSIPHLIQTDS